MKFEHLRTGEGDKSPNVAPTTLNGSLFGSPASSDLTAKMHADAAWVKERLSKDPDVFWAELWTLRNRFGQHPERFVKMSLHPLGRFGEFLDAYGVASADSARIITTFRLFSDATCF